MNDQTPPTLAEDEATLSRYASDLADKVEAVAQNWLTALVALRSPGLESSEQIAETLRQAASSTVLELRELLSLDIAEQAVGPLEILRRAVSVPTQILTDAAVSPVDRDEFSRTNFPDDLYDLTPASFAAIDPSLHEPGLIWGAAKAHVHLRRRREQVPAVEQGVTPPARKVVVLSVDLMDRSKISAALPDATLVRSTAKLVEAAVDADLVLVDLGRLDDLAVVHEIGCPVIAFGSHVNEAQLAAAQAAGAESLPRSVFFRRLESGEV